MQSILLVFANLAYALAVCPDEVGDLTNWSEEYPNDLDVLKKDLVISKPIRLDISPPEVRSITIIDKGRLVWGTNGDHSLQTHYIRIQNGGEMHIGGEKECQFTKKATITLLGEPDEASVGQCGAKFICVEAGGVLELHGKDKLSWTKLVKTAPKYDPEAAEIYSHKAEKFFTVPEIHLFRIKKGTQLQSKPIEVIRLSKRVTWWKERDTDKFVAVLVEFINSIENGDIFAIATHKNVMRNDLSKLYDAIDGLGANNLKKLKAGETYAAIGVKGESFEDEIGELIPGEDLIEATVSLAYPNEEREIIVSSYNMKLNSKVSTEFLIMNTLLTQPIIEVYDNVGTWNIGDEIFITSTDYDWKQVEEFKIVHCNGKCNDKQVRLNARLKYEHYGEIFQRVDMRAEAGLMTRHIHIQGKVSEGESNGGHIKFLEDFGSVRVEGVELTNMGQPLSLGRYPLHYHMCGNLSDIAKYPITPYLRKNSIHHCQFRFMTIHGTHNAEVTDNVGYDTVGHGFFIEDGGEKGTTYRRNLGLGNRKFEGTVIVPDETNSRTPTGAIPTDTGRGPATFWVTNPQTIAVDNVGAGGVIGMWYVYPDLPTAISRDKGFMQDKEARHTKIIRHENNVFHSYMTGLFVDNRENDDIKSPDYLTASGYNLYNPRSNPLDTSSPRIPCVFSRVTAYKNFVQQVWIRGSPCIVEKSSFSDSRNGVTLIREDLVWQEFKDNVVIGYSDNKGNPKKGFDRSFPGNEKTPIFGYSFLKGPVRVKGTWFGGFTPTDTRKAAAIVNRKCSLNPRNAVEDVTFGFPDDNANKEGNRFQLVEIVDKACPDINKYSLMAIRDVDGSLTNTGQESTIVKNHNFVVTGQCKRRQSWNAASCPYVYGEIQVRYSGDNKLVAYRTDRIDGTNGDNPGDFPTLALKSKSFLAILGGSHFYLALIDKKLPSGTITFNGLGVTNTNAVVLAFCLPPDASPKVTYRIGGGKGSKRNTEQVDSREKVLNDNIGGKYYFNSTTGVIFFKLIHEADFGGDDKLLTCPQGKCAQVQITVDASATMTNSNCADSFFKESSYTQNPSGVPTESTETLPADRLDPLDTQGAGSTYPFST